MSDTLMTHEWLLPDGVADVLFVDAQKLESLRDALLFVLTAHGHRLVSPPLIEYTETLLKGADEELKRQTFKIIDQMTGRLMGVRADITPQITRIDAQHGQGICRYGYVGQVIKTLPSGLFGLRTPMQLGAEIFGIELLDDAILAELSLMELMAALFDEIGMSRTLLHVDVGHVGVFARLCDVHGITPNQSDVLMSIYAKKDLPRLRDFCDTLAGGDDFMVLATHTLTPDRVPSADNLLTKFSDVAGQDNAIINACHEIARLATFIRSLGMTASVDVAELSGFHYHTGLLFNVYLNRQDTAQTQALVRGGRFGQTNRAASGFSMDINRLLEFVELESDTVIWVDFDDIQKANGNELADLFCQIKTLQDEGCVVIKPLSPHDKPAHIDGVLHRDDGQWAVKLVGDE